jgi:hypothetical protein
VHTVRRKVIRRAVAGGDGDVTANRGLGQETVFSREKQGFSAPAGSKAGESREAEIGQDPTQKWTKSANENANRDLEKEEFDALWYRLPAAFRTGILAMAKAASGM